MANPLAFRRFRYLLAAVCVILYLLFVLTRTDKPVSIPLATILSTSGQGGLQPVSDGYQMVDGARQFIAPTGEAFERLREATKGGVAANIFLVDAFNDIEAILISKDGFLGYRSLSSPVILNDPRPSTDNYWLVVYLGIAGSSPVRWQVDSVVVNSQSIRFNYHRDPRGVTSLDIHDYFYWVPVGKLANGVYNLEMFDTSLKAVTLMRRVEIAPKRR